MRGPCIHNLKPLGQSDKDPVSQKTLETGVSLGSAARISTDGALGICNITL